MALAYTVMKDVHIGTVVLSISLFALRGAWMVGAPQRLRQRWVRIVPHVIDTVLLASALWLAWQLGGAGPRGWLWAKVVGLLVYVVLGSVALKRGKTRAIRIVAFAAALATFGYIVSVAIAKSPLGFLARL